MRITSLSCSQYLAFADAADARLAPLTLIFGRNGSGKSSLLRLAQTLCHLNGEGSGPLSQGLLDSTGAHPDAVVYGGLGGEMSMGWHIEAEGRLWTFTWTVECLRVSALDRGRSPAAVRSLELRCEWPEGERGAIIRAGDRPGDIIVEEGAQAPVHGLTWAWLRPVLPPSAPTVEGSPAIELVWSASRTLAAVQVLALGARRRNHEQGSRMPLPDVEDRSEDGHLAGDMLAADERFGVGDLLRSTSRRFADITGWSIEVDLAELRGSPGVGSYEIMLSRDAAGPRVPLLRHGSGMRQVFPVVARCAAIAAGRLPAALYTFEEPEANLHPAGQAHLGDLFLDTALKAPAPIVVETHSEVLLLRVLRRIAEGKVKPEDVALLWVDDGPNGARVRAMPIGDDGWVEDWPAGVFAEDASENRAIARAIAERP